MFTVRVIAQIRIDRHDNDAAPRRAFEMAARWDPELDPPVQTHGGRDARTVIANLREGEGVSIASLDPALTWVERAERYYATTEPPLEGYRGPWQEAVGDMQEAARWLRLLRVATATVPTELKVEDPLSDRSAEPPIELRDLDHDTYAALARRALEANLSVPELLRQYTTDTATRPTIAEWVERTRHRSSTVATSDVVEALDESRGPWPT